MKTLSYWPTPYPDELLYSVIARYHRHTLGQGMKSTLAELFGRQTVCAVVDLPSGLAELQSRLPDCVGTSPESLAWTLTLLPYYAAFIPNERGNAVLQSMLSRNGGDIHARCGIAATTVSMPRYLRSCVECVRQDVAQYGETYWRRLFQLPGVLACPIHGVELTASWAMYRPTGRHDFVAADITSIPKPSKEGPSCRSLRIAIDLATKARELLARPQIPGMMQAASTGYHGEVRGAGYARRSRVDQARLHRDFCVHFGDSFLEEIGCSVSSSVDTSWLANMFRPRSKSSHPLQHILVRHFLESIEPKVPTFGTGPWPCLNPLADHFRQARITSIRYSQAKATGETVGTFLCDCGYAYAARPSLEHGSEPVPSVVVAHGPLYEATVRRALAEGKTVRAVAKSLGISWKTVKKLSTGTARVLRPAKSARTSLRPRNSVAKKPTASVGQRVDWVTRDRSMAELVRKTAADLKEAIPPLHVTRSAIAGVLGRGALHRNRLSLLPGTQEALADVCETRGQWQCRRLTWAAAELHREQRSPFRTTLTRAARLNDAHLTADAQSYLAKLAQTV